MSKQYISLFFLLFFGFSGFSQAPKKLSSSEIYHELRKLNFLGSALYLAAHPDDENTKLISYLVNDVHARTAYLSITRGDGGQNLIGTELRELLGIIRTQELLEARKIDGGEQFFTSANDFGFSKNPIETFAFWNKNRVLEEVVYTIRKFKPDIIINRFDHRSPGTTHGHHTASAMLSMEAFDIVNNPKKFSKSAKEFGIWQPKRIFFNTSWFFYGSEEKFREADKSEYLKYDIGSFYPELGLSNGEIAALSRSRHQSQGFGSSGTRGSENEYLEILKGSEPSPENLFEGINTSWTRIEGGSEIEKILKPLENSFDFTNPSAILPELLKAYPLVQNLKDSHWKAVKTEQLRNLILHCSGLFLEIYTPRKTINLDEEFPISIEVANRGKRPVTLVAIKDKTGENLWNTGKSLTENQVEKLKFNVRSQQKTYSTPYWLNEESTNGMYHIPDEFIGFPETPVENYYTIYLNFDGTVIPYKCEIVHKSNDPVKGEVYKPLAILPKVTASIPEKVIIFPNSDSRSILVKVRAGADSVSGVLKLSAPKGWKIANNNQSFALSKKGETQDLYFNVSPTNQAEEGNLKASVTFENQILDKELIVLDYDHIPTQYVLLPTASKIVPLDLKKKGNRIGYIHGAGDSVPESLEQIGYQISTLNPSEIKHENLSKFDAVVIGIRAFNTVPELKYANSELNEYVKNGGTVVVQYNTNHQLVTPEIAPYPLELSRDRVTDEHSKVVFLNPKHELLNKPNKITQKDFDGWVQERGLYFPNKWDKAFTPILGIHDDGEAQTQGSLLVAKYGKGHYIYTGLSFFRQLPAGVSGAYRLFANILSIGQLEEKN